jgi:type III secretory pathway component EscV
MSQTPDPRSVPQLLSDLARELTTLFRKEGQLIRAELSEKSSQLMVGVGEAAAGAICLLVSLNVLAGALVVAIARIGADPAAADPAIQDDGIGLGWASLIVGVLLAIIGAILVKRATSNMSNLTPERTVNQVSQDATLVKEQVR